MMPDNGFFCACSTPAGKSGIAVIRISGNGHADLLERAITVIRGYGDVRTLSQMPGYTSCFAIFRDPETSEEVDTVVITRFLSPHSYTGDDMTEISCHGGDAVKQEILRVLYGLGIRPAAPGEFTKRAFINGKLDLSEAEAVMGVIGSESRLALKASNSQLAGKLSSILNEEEGKLYKALSLIEMIVEFPEHDDTPENADAVREILTGVLGNLKKLEESYKRGRILTNRMKVVLAGSPNSGKSTLLNTIAGFDRAIVTDVPGTTRDTLEIMTEVEGIPVMIVDTAGIRRTSDMIEEIGVQRTMDALSEADICFFLIAPDETLDEVRGKTEQLLSSCDDIVLVFTKIDERDNDSEDEIREYAKQHGISRSVRISALSSLNMDSIKDEIVRHYEMLGGMSGTEVTVMSERHRSLLESANGKIESAVGIIDQDLGIDIASSVIRSALDDIGEITGKTVSANLVDRIFSDFCIGK